jgi:hypothetical protein
MNTGKSVLVAKGETTTITIDKEDKLTFESIIYQQKLGNSIKTLRVLIESYLKTLSEKDQTLIYEYRKKFRDGELKRYKKREPEVKTVLELSQGDTSEVYTNKEPVEEEFFDSDEEIKDPCAECNPNPEDCSKCEVMKNIK